MTTLKDVIKYIVGTSNTEREAIHVVLECLRERPEHERLQKGELFGTDFIVKSNEHNPVAKELLKPYREVGQTVKDEVKQMRKTKKRKAKRKFKRNPLDMFNKDGPRKQVWFALKRSEGALSANDLAVVLPLKPAIISKALSDLWAGRWGRHIVREKDPNRKVRGINYLYRYTGPKVKSDTTLVQDAYGTGMAENDQP